MYQEQLLTIACRVFSKTAQHNTTMIAIHLSVAFVWAMDAFIAPFFGSEFEKNVYNWETDCNFMMNVLINRNGYIYLPIICTS